MSIDQKASADLSAWLPEGMPTRPLNEDFSATVFGVEDLTEIGLSRICILISMVTPSKPKVFNWDAAERRADWEEVHNRFAEFGDMKDLLSDLRA